MYAEYPGRKYCGMMPKQEPEHRDCLNSQDDLSQIPCRKRILVLLPRARLCGFISPTLQRNEGSVLLHDRHRFLFAFQRSPIPLQAISRAIPGQHATFRPNFIPVCRQICFGHGPVKTGRQGALVGSARQTRNCAANIYCAFLLASCTATTPDPYSAWLIIKPPSPQSTFCYWSNSVQCIGSRRQEKPSCSLSERLAAQALCGSRHPTIASEVKKFPPLGSISSG